MICTFRERIADVRTL